MSRAGVFLVAPNTSYQLADFVAACARAQVDVCVAVDRCRKLDVSFDWPAANTQIDLASPGTAVKRIVAAATEHGNVRAVVSVSDERGSVIASRAARELGLPANPPESAALAYNKLALRHCLSSAKCRSPRFTTVEEKETASDAARRVAEELGWPCVLKPVHLSASRGVIRADGAASFVTALARIRRLLDDPVVRAIDQQWADTILVESFIPGVEVAFEGLLTDSKLVRLALFDKPDPLDGPFFEETIYVTPSRHDDAVQREIHNAVAAATAAMELSCGPVHAELRLSADGPVIIEVAARSIGGLCGRALRFDAELTLEDVIVRHAVGQDVAPQLCRRAAGAMMLPIGTAGVLREVGGVDRARAVPGIDDVIITVDIGQRLMPLPEGSSYLGFLLASGDSPQAVEAALREAHAALEFGIVKPLDAASPVPA